jgi:hypothetical protein
MNILFVVIDTLRTSRLGCYGYGAALDNVSAQSFRLPARC